MGVSFRPDTMTVITSDGLKARPEGPKGRRSRKKNKGKTEKVVPPIWESSSNRRIRVTKTEIREECNVRMRSVKSPKYYCRSCEVDICKKCLQSWCNAHDVQWIGNNTFNCQSPNHRFGSCF